MPLPDLIEIVPLEKPVKAEITVPGSKSITNRALILAALADGEVTLNGALWSEDTQVMVDCLQKLGFAIAEKPDADEFCNRTITVQGLGGKIPNAGRAEKPLELFVGNAGTAARFLAAFVCLGNGVYRLSGVPRMHERPQAALFKALREMGYRVDSANDKLPAVIHGRGPAEAQCSVSIEESSQFASALMMCAGPAGWSVKVVGQNAEESPYIKMTGRLIKDFPKTGPEFFVEPDASSASYIWAAGILLDPWKSGDEAELEGLEETLIKSLDAAILVKKWPVDQKKAAALFKSVGWSDEKSEVSVAGSYGQSLQVDDKFYGFWPAQPAEPPKEVSRGTDLGDSIMTLAVLAPFARHPIKFTNLGRMRLQETERVVALRTELSRCGAKVVEEGDTLTVYPSKLHGAEIETYDDHRMAMCFAILGLKVPGIKIKNPACVKKTFPNFFQKLAAEPPAGLGAEVWEIKNGVRARKLSGDDLFAE